MASRPASLIAMLENREKRRRPVVSRSLKKRHLSLEYGVNDLDGRIEKIVHDAVLKHTDKLYDRRESKVLIDEDLGHILVLVQDSEKLRKLGCHMKRKDFSLFTKTNILLKILKGPTLCSSLKTRKCKRVDQDRLFAGIVHSIYLAIRQEAEHRVSLLSKNKSQSIKNTESNSSIRHFTQGIASKRPDFSSIQKRDKFPSVRKSASAPVLPSINESMKVDDWRDQVAIKPVSHFQNPASKWTRADGEGVMDRIDGNRPLNRVTDPNREHAFTKPAIIFLNVQSNAIAYGAAARAIGAFQGTDSSRAARNKTNFNS